MTRSILNTVFPDTLKSTSSSVEWRLETLCRLFINVTVCTLCIWAACVGQEINQTMMLCLSYPAKTPFTIVDIATLLSHLFFRRMSTKMATKRMRRAIPAPDPPATWTKGKLLEEWSVAPMVWSANFKRSVNWSSISNVQLPTEPHCTPVTSFHANGRKLVMKALSGMVLQALGTYKTWATHNI